MLGNRHRGIDETSHCRLSFITCRCSFAIPAHAASVGCGRSSTDPVCIASFAAYPPGTQQPSECVAARHTARSGWKDRQSGPAEGPLIREVSDPANIDLARPSGTGLFLLLVAHFENCSGLICRNGDNPLKLGKPTMPLTQYRWRARACAKTIFFIEDTRVLRRRPSSSRRTSRTAKATALRDGAIP